jgi:hypothetical protein
VAAARKPPNSGNRNWLSRLPVVLNDGAVARASGELCAASAANGRVQCGISQFTNQVGTRYILGVVNL